MAQINVVVVVVVVVKEVVCGRDHAHIARYTNRSTVRVSKYQKFLAFCPSRHGFYVRYQFLRFNSCKTDSENDKQSELIYSAKTFNFAEMFCESGDNTIHYNYILHSADP